MYERVEARGEGDALIYYLDRAVKAEVRSQKRLRSGRPSLEDLGLADES